MPPATILSYPRARYNGAAVASLAKTTPNLSWTIPSPRRPTWPRCTTPTMPSRKLKIQNPETTIALPVLVEELLHLGEQGGAKQESQALIPCTFRGLDAAHEHTLLVLLTSER